MIRSDVCRGAGLILVLLLQAGCIQWEPLTRHFASRGSDRRARATKPISVEEVGMKLAEARALERRGDLDQAIAAFWEIVDQHDSPLAFHRLGVLYDGQGSFDQSETMYRNAVALDSENPNLLCDFGYSYYLRGLDEESEALLRKSIQLSPRLKRAHNNLGLLLTRRGQYNAALRAFAVASDSHGQGQQNLAYAMALNGGAARAGEPAPTVPELDTPTQPATEALASTRPAAPEKSAEPEAVEVSSMSQLQEPRRQIAPVAGPATLRNEQIVELPNAGEIASEFRMSPSVEAIVTFDTSAEKPRLTAATPYNEDGWRIDDAATDHPRLAEQPGSAVGDYVTELPRLPLWPTAQPSASTSTTMPTSAPTKNAESLSNKAIEFFAPEKKPMPQVVFGE